MSLFSYSAKHGFYDLLCRVVARIRNKCEAALSPTFGMSSICVDNKIITIIIIAFVVIMYDL